MICLCIKKHNIFGSANELTLPKVVPIEKIALVIEACTEAFNVQTGVVVEQAPAETHFIMDIDLPEVSEIQQFFTLLHEKSFGRICSITLGDAQYATRKLHHWYCQGYVAFESLAGVQLREPNEWLFFYNSDAQHNLQAVVLHLGVDCWRYSFYGGTWNTLKAQTLQEAKREVQKAILQDAFDNYHTLMRKTQQAQTNFLGLLQAIGHRQDCY